MSGIASLGQVDLVSREALRISKSAENHALEANHMVGKMAAEMGLMRSEMTVGFNRLEKRIERANRAAFDSKHKIDEWESDSKVHLIKELDAAKHKLAKLDSIRVGEVRRWKWWALGIAAAIIAAILVDLIGHLTVK